MRFNHNTLTIMNFPSNRRRVYCHSTKEVKEMNTVNLSSQKFLFGLFSLCGFLFLSASPALAMISVRDAQLTVREAQASCPELNCPDSRAQVKALSRDEAEKLPAETQKFLRVAAKSFAETLWPDTILESAYEVEFRMRVDGLEILSIDKKAVGYRISFSAIAWDRDQCPAFTEEEMAQKPVSELIKEKCLKGRVFDRTFAIPDPTGTFDDELFSAHFKN